MIKPFSCLPLKSVNVLNNPKWYNMAFKGFGTNIYMYSKKLVIEIIEGK